MIIQISETPARRVNSGCNQRTTDLLDVCRVIVMNRHQAGLIDCDALDTVIAIESELDDNADAQRGLFGPAYFAEKQRQKSEYIEHVRTDLMSAKGSSLLYKHMWMAPKPVTEIC